MVPLIQIVFFIAVNVLPAGQTKFEISTPEGKVFTYASQPGGGWKPVPVPEGGAGVWSVKGDTLLIMRPDGGSDLKMGQFFTNLDAVAWSTVAELTEGKTPIRLIRKKSEITVLRGSPPRESRSVIRW